MVNPISPSLPSPIGPQSPTPGATSGIEGAGGASFATQLRQQLEQVSHMQAEAEAGIQKLLTGQTDNITQVLTTARKAEVAFGLLMEIRNKLVDAYGELKQLRV